MFLMTGEMQTLHPKGTANVNTTPRPAMGLGDDRLRMRALRLQDPAKASS